MKKGFTLIELLGVMVILSLIVALSFPTIINFIKSSSDENDELVEDVIVSAAEKYLKENKDNYPSEDGRRYCISVMSLVDEGYLSDDIIFSNKDVVNDKSVDIVYNNGYMYKVRNSTNCTYSGPCKNLGPNDTNDIGDEVVCGENVVDSVTFQEAFYIVDINEANRTATLFSKQALFVNAVYPYQRFDTYSRFAYSSFDENYNNSELESFISKYLKSYENYISGTYNVYIAKTTLMDLNLLNSLGCSEVESSTTAPYKRKVNYESCTGSNTWLWTDIAYYLYESDTSHAFATLHSIENENEEENSRYGIRPLIIVPIDDISF